MTSPFRVSNGYAYPPLWGIYGFPYQWGSFTHTFPCTWFPISTAGFINISTTSDAASFTPSGFLRQDSLVVRVYNNNSYPPYLNYNIIFEKVIPINVR